jgi:hypothetical protein
MATSTTPEGRHGYVRRDVEGLNMYLIHLHADVVVEKKLASMDKSTG